ncbi:Uncharacterised protein [Salmonella enterica subsp. enterica serovar Typhimurium str. DT104]|nr:Uncharacterised protein [Salmonella enterica subsp. enterica serovar Typhimurium str. DT104]
MIELMITDSGSVILHGIQNIDNRFTLRQAADIRSGKVISGIKKPRRLIFGFFLLHQRGDIGPTANIAFTVSNPRYFIRLHMGV